MVIYYFRIFTNNNIYFKQKLNTIIYINIKMKITDIYIKNIKDLNLNGKNNNKLFLPNSDLIFTPFDFVLVFPQFLDEKKLIESLKILINKYYFLTGRVKFDTVNHYIEITENYLPFSYVDDYNTKQFSNNEINDSIVKPFLKPFVESVVFNPTNINEPLLKIVFTKIFNSKESVLGISWNHVLGDIKTIYNFIDTFNKIYKDCSFEIPIFNKHFILSDELEEINEENIEQIETSLIYNNFQKLWWVIPQIIWDMLFVSNMLILDFTILEIDILKKKLNNESKHKNKEIKNCNFFDVAINNRESIETFKNKKYLMNYIYKKEYYIKNNFNYGMPNPLPYPNEIFINSYHKVDFRKLNFGTDFARYYDTFSANYFMRIFKKNPYEKNNSWVLEEGSIEINIRLPKKYYDKIKSNINFDKKMNFKNI
jgi:hypothetical protein